MLALPHVGGPLVSPTSSGMRRPGVTWGGHASHPAPRGGPGHPPGQFPCLQAEQPSVLPDSMENSRSALHLVRLEPAGLCCPASVRVTRVC